MRLPWKNIKWRNTIFLFGTLLTTLIAVPIYIWHHGLSVFQLTFFTAMFIATGLSITLGYHRLFSHLAFEAAWPVKAFVLLFGAAAFEGSALEWSADHRRHHKHVDHDEDPYDISKGLFFAHIGWLLFRTGPETPLTWVRDLQKDRMAVLQHRYYAPLAFLMGFGFPTLVGYLAAGPVGALGSFLIAGVARVVFVHHMTFCINSLCHWIGEQPYSSKCSARDSFFMALFTFGEGYHNFHHEFQHDYRNGVKAWHWDPTKWTIWALHKLGFVRNLRRVPQEKLLKAQFEEQKRRLTESLSSPHPATLSESVLAMMQSSQERAQAALASWQQLLEQYLENYREMSRDRQREFQRSIGEASLQFREAMEEWLGARHLVLAKLDAA